jgi:hypothetical protein
MKRSVWASLVATGAMAVASAADAMVLENCGGGCMTDFSGMLFNVDYTVPPDGQLYRWDLWTDTDHPDLLINVPHPNETFDTETVSNGDGTFYNDGFLLSPGYTWSETQAPGHTTIYAHNLGSNFNTCSAASPAGEICAASFNVWGNGTSVTVNSAQMVEIFFSQTAIPEPATWAMMLTGFFGLGGVLRRRRAAVAVAGESRQA